MATAELERIGEATAKARRQAADLDLDLEHAVIAAHAAGESVSSITTQARVSRGRVYAILRRHDVTVNSDAGRALVRHRWRETPTKAPLRVVTGLEALRTSNEAAVIVPITQPHSIPDEQPDLFSPPINVDPEPEMSVLEFLQKMRLEREQRGES